MCFSEFTRTMYPGWSKTCFPTRTCFCRINTRAWWIVFAKPILNTFVCSLRSKNLDNVSPSTKSSCCSLSLSSPSRVIRRSSARPSNSRRSSFSSSVNNSLAAFLIRARFNWTRHTSRLFLSPYCPTIRNSWSSLSFSNGLRGVLNDFV